MVDGLVIAQAFAAGVLSFFAPCSIAMLPAYMSYYVARPAATAAPTGDGPGVPASRKAIAAGLALAGAGLFGAGIVLVFRIKTGHARLGPEQGALMAAGTALVVGAARLVSATDTARGARIGLTTAMGMLGVFGLLGVPLYGLLRIVSFEAQSAVVLAVAAAMVVLGVLGLLGKGPSLSFALRAPKGRDTAAFLLFGAGYGVVAMGCNLSLFLLAVLSPLTRDADAVTGLSALLAYGAGMGFLLVALTVALALGRTALESHVRRAVPVAKVAANVLLIAAGLYVAWYDLTVLRLTA